LGGGFFWLVFLRPSSPKPLLIQIANREAVSIRSTQS
jgi:hypothetical protein